MKKLALILALILSLSLFAACGSQPAASGSDTAMPATLDEIMDKLYEGFTEDELPALPTAEDLKLMNEQNTGNYLDLNEELSESYAGVPSTSYVEGIASEPMMMGVAHRVVILRAESAEAAAQLAKDVEANANPRWNICTEAEKTYVSSVDDVVVLIMSQASTVDKMAANLAALAG